MGFPLGGGQEQVVLQQEQEQVALQQEQEQVAFFLIETGVSECLHIRPDMESVRSPGDQAFWPDSS